MEGILPPRESANYVVSCANERIKIIPEGVEKIADMVMF